MKDRWLGWAAPQRLVQTNAVQPRTVGRRAKARATQSLECLLIGRHARQGLARTKVDRVAKKAKEAVVVVESSAVE